MKLHLLFASCILSLSAFFAQTVNKGLPYTFKEKVIKTKKYYTTPTFDLAAQIQEDEFNFQESGQKVYRFGKEFPVALDIFSDAEKTVLPGGDVLYQYGIHCQKAVSVNLIFDQFNLAPGVVVYVSDPLGKTFDGAYTSLNNNSNYMLGTDVVFAEKVIIEVFVPKDKVGESKLHLGTIVHGYKNLNDMAKGLNTSQDCEIDVNCPLGSGWENQRNSVAMMMQGGGFCTGALVNNTSGTIIPYFLTANHCGTSAGSWVFRFRWEAPSGQTVCNGVGTSGNGPETMNINGGTLRANNANSDFVLVELSSAPDPAWGIYYNGWDRSGIAPTQATAIHHPDGDIKKISRDEDDAVESSWAGTSANSHWRVISWDQGVTEGGSSGSPLFDQNHRVVGQLHGGASSCGNDASNMWDDYGKFSESWTGGGTNSTRLSNWLDPNNTGALFIDGTDPSGSSVTLDAGINAPQGVSGIICGATVIPQVTISNSGTETLTQLTIEYGFDGVNTLTYDWTGSLATFQTQVITLPSIDLTNGDHTFSASVINPNQGIDENLNNDEVTSSFTNVLNGELDTLNLNLDQYGSEVTWNLKDPNNVVIYSGGPYSDASSCVTTLVQVPMCLSYACYTFTINDDYGDGLNTQNCPGSYAITRPDGSNLIELLSADADYGSSKVTAFCVEDDMSVTSLLMQSGILVYPNPAINGLTIDSKFMIPNKIELVSLLGQTVFSTVPEGNQTICDISNIQEGMYLVQIYTKTGIVTVNTVIMK